MRHFDFIINEGYPEANKEFAAASGDPNLASEVIGQFRTLVNRNQVQGNERNIDWWRKQGWEQFNQFVVQKIQQPSKTQVKRQKVAGRSITLMESDQWLIVIPLDKEASCFHGKNSDWCTTKPYQPYFENYFYDREVTLIYCLNKQTGGMWAIAAHRKLEGKWEIFDQDDRSITDGQLFQQTGLNVKRIVDVALSDVHQPEVQKSRVGYRESLDRTDALSQEWVGVPILERPPREPAIEKELLYNKHGQSCFYYIKNVAQTIDAQNRSHQRAEGRHAIDATKFPEAIALSALQYGYGAIVYFFNPTERMQMATIQEDPMNIRLIDEPTPKVQIAAVDSDLASAQFIKNPDPELFKKFPSITNLLRYMVDTEYEKFLPRVYDLIQEAVDEIIWDWEGSDDYYSQWQAEQARERGYLLFPDGTPYEGDPDDLENELEERELDISDMEIDWDRARDDDSINSYLDYNQDAKYMYDNIYEVLGNLTPENIREWTNQFVEEMGDDMVPEVSELDKVIAWKFREQNVEQIGDLVDDKLYVRKNKDGTYKVDWIRS